MVNCLVEAACTDEHGKTEAPCVAGPMVGARGFEPPTTSTPRMCATRLRYAPTR